MKQVRQLKFYWYCYSFFWTSHWIMFEVSLVEIQYFPRNFRTTKITKDFPQEIMNPLSFQEFQSWGKSTRTLGRPVRLGHDVGNINRVSMVPFVGYVATLKLLTVWSTRTRLQSVHLQACHPMDLRVCSSPWKPWKALDFIAPSKTYGQVSKNWKVLESKVPTSFFIFLPKQNRMI